MKSSKKPLDITPLILEFGEEKAVIEIVTAFINRLPDKMNLLDHHVQKNEYDDVHRIAHSIRGGAKNIGATNLAAHAFSLEKEAKLNKLSNAAEQIRLLRDDTQDLLRSVNNLTARFCKGDQE